MNEPKLTYDQLVRWSFQADITLQLDFSVYNYGNKVVKHPTITFSRASTQRRYEGLDLDSLLNTIYHSRERIFCDFCAPKWELK